MLSNFSYTIHRLFYGRFIYEAIFIDTLLECFKEGEYYDLDTIVLPHVKDGLPPEFVERKINQLLNDGFLERCINPLAVDSITITSAGLFHLAAGGYLAKIKQGKNAFLTLYVAVATLIVAVITLFITLYTRQ